MRNRTAVGRITNPCDLSSENEGTMSNKINQSDLFNVLGIDFLGVSGEFLSQSFFLSDGVCMDYSQNERLVLQCLRRKGELSRAEISRMTGLSAQTASVLIGRLLQDDLVVETRKRYGSIGKPATQMQLNPQGAYSLGIKLGRKDITIVLVDFTGVVIDRVFLQQDLSRPEAEMELILQESNQLFVNNPGSAFRLAGIGVAAPFRLEAWHQELGLDRETSQRLAAWAGFDIVAALQRRFGCEVFMENDGTAAAMAEMLFGVGRHISNFVYLFLDVVVGGGIVSGGDILRGKQGNSGDLALMRVGSPGNSSLLLEHASLFQLLNELRKAGIDKPRITQLGAENGKQRELFDEWVERAAQAISLAIFNMHSLLDTEAIVLASRLPRELMQYFIQRLQLALEEEHRLDPGQSLPFLIEGENRTDVHALGAAMVPYYHRYAPERSQLQGAIP